ncbi:MAG: saccharopine dehydrogenase NADP-binding domain-containing protein [Ahniella sp.]|nr:saccharopine dehydrogenase NADP-binding domain-containing protein [Ahniella sp.]
MGGWMLYGANGYTAGLILKRALANGHQPVLAGRSRESIEALAHEHNLPARIFPLDNPETVKSALQGIDVVLHCAGPYSATAAPMIEGCLAVGAHYLDITGELDVFAYAHAQDERARERGILLMPGTGFDVVPTDCLAAMLKAALPDATELVLAFEAGGGPSQGTAKTAVEGLGKGGRIRRNGKLERVPLAYKTRTFDRGGEPRFAMTIPWGDVYTSFVSTGIPNVEVYMGVSPGTAERVKKLNWVRWLLDISPVQQYLKSKVQQGGPAEAKRSGTDSYIWGEVRNAAGKQVSKQLQTPNGYELTAESALRILEHVLKHPPKGGYSTPSQLLGKDFVLSLSGCKLV